MKTKLIALSVLAASVVSASSMAAVETGQLQFSWNGIVPAKSLTGANFAFVDASDLVFVPGTEKLNIALNASGDMIAQSVKPYDFHIVATDGNAPVGGKITRAGTDKGFTANGIKAYLNENPVSAGFAGNYQLKPAALATAAENEVAITLNGKILKVGLENAIDVGAVSNASKDAQVLIELNANAKKDKLVDGSSVSFTAPVIFTVDLIS